MVLQLVAHGNRRLRHRPAWLGSFDFRFDPQSTLEVHSVVAKDGDVMVAVGMLWRPHLHRSHYEVEVLTRPESRNKETVRSIINYLMGQRHRRDIPITMAGFSDDDMMKILRDLDARTIQRVPPPRVQTSRRAAINTTAMAGPAVDASLSSLCRAVTEMYMWTHASWAPVRAEEAGQICTHLGVPGEVDLEASSVALDKDQQILALSLVFDQGVPMVIAESISESTTNGKDLVAACLKRSLSVLAKRGITEVDFDGHVTDTHFFPIWNSLEPEGSKWEILEVSGNL